MPKASKGRKHSGDVIGNSTKVIRVATGEGPGCFDGENGKDPAAQSLGQRGGWARAKALSAKKRKDIARAAAHARWKS